MSISICKIAEYYGHDRQRDALSLTQYDVVITSYGTVSAEFVAKSKDTSQTRRGKQLINHVYILPLSCIWIFISFCVVSFGSVSPLWLVHWRRIVLDEAHFIKSHTTRTCRAVCSIKATYRWCLTGTPIQNSVEDLFSLLHFLKVDPWGSWVMNASLLSSTLRQFSVVSGLVVETRSWSNS